MSISDVQFWNTTLPTPQSRRIAASVMVTLARSRQQGELAYLCDADVFPPYQEALTQAKERLSVQRTERDPFLGTSPVAPTPHNGSVRLVAGGLSSCRHGSAKADRATALDMPARTAKERDHVSRRLLQQTVMFMSRELKALHARRCCGAAGALSVGHIGTVFIDSAGRPGVLGQARLPQAGKANWPMYTECACLDAGVALLAGASGDVYFAGSFREHAPAPPRSRRGSSSASPTPPTLTPAQSLFDLNEAVMLRRVSGHVKHINGSRGRLATVDDDGMVHFLSPTAIRYALGAGVVPFTAIREIAVGQGADIHFIRQDSMLDKCSVSAKTCTTPRHVTTLSHIPVAAVAAGFNFCMAVDTAGRLWGHGRNEKGQLGVNSRGEAVRTFATDSVLNERYFVVGVACGRQHSVAVTADGFVFVTGDNKYGQLGLTQADTEPLPRRAPNSICQFTKLRLPRACVGVACGTFSTMFVLDDGAVFACGNNDFGQLGLPVNSVVAPPQRVDAIDARGGVLNWPCKSKSRQKEVAACCDGCAVA